MALRSVDFVYVDDYWQDVEFEENIIEADAVLINDMKDELPTFSVKGENLEFETIKVSSAISYSDSIEEDLSSLDGFFRMESVDAKTGNIIDLFDSRKPKPPTTINIRYTET